MGLLWSIGKFIPSGKFWSLGRGEVEFRPLHGVKNLSGSVIGFFGLQGGFVAGAASFL